MYGYLGLELGIRDKTALFHFDQRQVCFPPIQFYRFRRIIQGCSKENYQLLLSPYSSFRQTDCHPPSPQGGFSLFEVRAPSPTRPDFSSLTPTHILHPERSPPYR
ncbi:hypothetical protein AVEN_248112-1 [Araneus ventricosus]|uniref:Uncharacterized protein n=1 Tax=Araneus ventricosus TaxID=182803 RepID=A0A4Y2NDT5_ARAVE|nr:hypothetical protein AVEN_248112-1 [Araneus ventricosus]